MAGMTIAVTGAAAFFGQHLALALDADPAVDAVIAIDSKPPAKLGAKSTWARLDLVHPRSAEQLAEILRLRPVDAFVHTAFLSRPVHQGGGWAHELEAIGTRHVLAAVEATGVRKFVLRSSTLAYGALPTHPNFLVERSPLSGGAQSSFLADKVEAEAQTTAFAQRNPERVATILRFAPLLGFGADTIATTYLRRRFCPMLLGFDPLVQFLHEDDAIDAARAAVHRDVRGAINIGAPGVTPLSQAIRVAGGRALPLPRKTLQRLSEALWTARVGEFPPGFLTFLKYPCVGDLRRMREELEFKPRHDVRSAIQAFSSALQTSKALAA